MNLKIRATILELAKKKNQVIYGGQALNKQLPINLQKETKDFDIYTKKPKKSAEELAKILKQKTGEEFTVQPAKYGKTFKVKKGKETIADYTLTTKKPKSKNEFGVKYADLKYQKNKIKKILKNPEAEYRWSKDSDTLNRIKKGEMKKSQTSYKMPDRKAEGVWEDSNKFFKGAVKNGLI